MKKEDYDLRERTKQFALRTIRMFAALPKSTEAQVLGKQVFRSATSIGTGGLDETFQLSRDRLNPTFKELNGELAT